MRTLLLLVTLVIAAGKASKAGETQVNPGEVNWSQVNWETCGGIKTNETRIKITAIRYPLTPPLMSSKQVLMVSMGGDMAAAATQPSSSVKLVGSAPDCWPVQLWSNAMQVFNVRCTRCHGETGPPEDTEFTFEKFKGEVGEFDMRTYDGIMKGGVKGRAVIAGDAKSSLLYRGMVRDLMSPEEGSITNDDSVAMPPFLPSPFVEIEAVRQWIEGGAPVMR